MFVYLLNVNPQLHAMHRIFYWLLVGGLSCVVQCELCKKCPGGVTGDSIIKLLCSNTTGAVLSQGCCVLHDNVIGLDWSKCNITELHSYQFDGLSGSLLWLDLSGNNVPLEYFNVSFRLLGGLNKLQLLHLPSGIECDTDAWEGSTMVQDTMLCSEPVLCNVSHSMDDGIPIMNISDISVSVCPPNSHCVPDGPGLHQCICNNDHHGYKCIQKRGAFPYPLFFSVATAAGIVIVAADFLIRRFIRHHKR